MRAANYAAARLSSSVAVDHTISAVVEGSSQPSLYHTGVADDASQIMLCDFGGMTTAVRSSHTT
jgi:hypothetical protein